jgi:hypothetical protein
MTRRSRLPRGVDCGRVPATRPRHGRAYLPASVLRSKIAGGRMQIARPLGAVAWAASLLTVGHRSRFSDFAIVRVDVW